jgi:hypothetical protein
MEESSKLNMFERMTLRKIQGPMKEGEGWRIRRNRVRNDILKTGDTLKFIKFLRLRWYGHVESVQNQRIAKQITTAEGIRKRERPRKRLRDEAEEYLNRLEMKHAGNGQRPSGIEEYRFESQGPQGRVALEEEEEEEKEEKEADEEAEEEEEQQQQQQEKCTQ